jgi:vitamin B12 transporter
VTRFKTALAAFVLLPTPVLADDGTIVVTANRIEQDAKTVGQAITVIDRALIETRQTVAIADLLATTPGVSAVRNGGFGGISSVFIRGASSDQTLVLIDGVRVNDPASPSGAYDFGNLQTTNIDRIEVLRGANSVIWGSQAMGGIVNIVTLPTAEKLTIQARGEYGDYDTANVSGNVALRAGPVKASLGGGYFSTAGISAQANNIERDGADRQQANGRVEVALSDNFGLDFRGFYARSFAELDGFNPTSATRQINGYAGGYAKLFDQALTLRGAYSVSDIRRDSTSAFGDSRFEGRSERAELQGDARLSSWLRVVFGAESEWSRAESTFSAGAQRTRLSSVYGQLLVEPITGLNLAGGVRHDDHRTFGGETTLGGNAAYSFSGTTLRASYAEGFKAPALDQLFAIYGNTALTPERARSVDIGIEQRLLGDRLVARVTAFDRKTRDQIVFFSCSTNPNPLCTGRGAFGAYYLNIARATADGVEFELIAKPVDALTFSANYTHLRSINRTAPNADKDLPRRPRDTANASLDWAKGRYSLGATVSLVGDSFDNASNATRLDSFVVAGLRGSVGIIDGLTFYGRIENLFNERYQVATGFNTLGRNAHVGVRAKF